MSSHSHSYFATTRWSMVMNFASTHPPDAGIALAELAQRYWYPVYAYLRYSGHAPAEAQDMAYGFFACLPRQFRTGRAHSSQSHFRHYLLGALNEFLEEETHASPDGGSRAELAAPPDLEARYRFDNPDAASAEHAYRHSFAIEVIARASERLRAEAHQAGHLKIHQALEPFLARDPVANERDVLAARLGMRPLALMVALKGLRQRFRELAENELADTVTTAEDFAAEQAALRAILHEGQSPS